MISNFVAMATKIKIVLTLAFVLYYFNRYLCYKEKYIEDYL